jgi:hypothetical protein
VQVVSAEAGVGAVVGVVVGVVVVVVVEVGAVDVVVVETAELVVDSGFVVVVVVVVVLGAVVVGVAVLGVVVAGVVIWGVTGVGIDVEHETPFMEAARSSLASEGSETSPGVPPSAETFSTRARRLPLASI